MSNTNTWMVDLLKRQESERQDLAAGAYEAWQSVKEQENKLLEIADGKYESASDEIQDEITKAREDYFNEWSSDGKLAALMSERHTKERERLNEKQKIFDRLQEDRQKNKDRGR